MVTLLQNCADGEKNTGQLEREKVEPRPSPHFSSGSGSSFGEQVGPEPAGPELVGSDTLSTSNVEVGEVCFISTFIFHTDDSGHAVTIIPYSTSFREKTLFWQIIIGAGLSEVLDIEMF